MLYSYLDLFSLNINLCWIYVFFSFICLTSNSLRASSWMKHPAIELARLMVWTHMIRDMPIYFITKTFEEWNWVKLLQHVDDALFSSLICQHTDIWIYLIVCTICIYIYMCVCRYTQMFVYQCLWMPCRFLVQPGRCHRSPGISTNHRNLPRAGWWFEHPNHWIYTDFLLVNNMEQHAVFIHWLCVFVFVYVYVYVYIHIHIHTIY